MSDLNSILLDATIVVDPYLIESTCVGFIVENPQVTVEIRTLGKLATTCLEEFIPNDYVRIIGSLHTEGGRAFILATQVERSKK
jgi:hypothetical protein